MATKSCLLYRALLTFLLSEPDAFRFPELCFSGPSSRFRRIGQRGDPIRSRRLPLSGPRVSHTHNHLLFYPGPEPSVKTVMPLGRPGRLSVTSGACFASRVCHHSARLACRDHEQRESRLLLSRHGTIKHAVLRYTRGDLMRLLNVS
ncbi:hypothetical protein ElyMa_005289400 [Elysia marginata]|uniref:Secreted protein n=1 Tax=Elysia marginata TaxID=1093978 RepID=A0AAV4K006_9GAST|nr:hypothetical protein ElyMa_005289400 [Elysia marginata]